MNSTPALRAPTIARSSGIFSLGRAQGAILVLGASTVLMTACGTNSPPPNSTSVPGTVLVKPPPDGTHFVVDANHGGQGNSIKLTGAFWGRLVDVFDLDAAGLTTLQFHDFVIGDNIASDLIDYRLDRNPITETETLTILHPAGTAAYQAAFQQIDLNVQPVKKNGTNPLPSATLTAMPRNAALVLMFDDLLDATKINSKNIAVLTGYPPIQPYEPRVIPDPSHGDLDATGVFHTTRVVVDVTISQIESQQSNPPLPVNSLGLPEAAVTDQPNVIIRLPTNPLVSVGQLTVLTNLSGSGMRFAENAPNDAASATLDIVRSLRSSSADLGDPNNGFLVDDIAPRIIGVQGITLINIQPTGGTTFLIDALFDAAACAPQPRLGDVIRIGSSALAVVNQIGSAPSGGFITGVSVDLQVGTASDFLPGQAQYLMPFDPTLGVPAPCFVRFSPAPTILPDKGIAPNSSITVRFSEPMDPTSISGLESFAVTRVTNANAVIPLGNTIVAATQPSLDLKEFTYLPTLPFERNPGNFPAGEDYKFTLRGGTGGAIDLSGKALADTLQPFNFTLDASAGAVGSRGFVFNCNSADQDGNGAPELRGQFLFNLTKGTIRPRPVTRFSAVADANQPVVGLMVPFTAPIQTPLSNLGSKMMAIYRYSDLGFGLVDDSTLNVDLEGLSWAPFLGLQVDTFPLFRMAFCHSKFIPDEMLNAFNLPFYPNSGLVKTFDNNILDPVNDPLAITHPKDRGYFLQPVDSFVASTGTLMMPYPLNRGLTKAQYLRYTFRDTSLLAVGGPGGAGVETDINGFALGVTPVKQYLVNKVPTLGLPLLMEFRCYDSNAAFGLNGFKVNIAVNSSSRPAFRAFSTGGVLANGSLHKIFPDNEPNATGGITPAGVPTGPGTEIDPVFYPGQADFVVRVNRVHTVWLDTLQFTAQYQTPIVEPPNSLQPAGTQVIIALRGASNVTNGQPATGQPLPKNDATKYDAYGDPKPLVVLPGVPLNFAPQFLLGPNNLPDKNWKTNLALLNIPPGGQVPPRFIQARITMLSNPDTLLIPEISAFGIALKY